jgi:prepilin-type processing-associated H-X9-DG protein/prepilin-type N-terminal cleavage/methylation domain-containing protein
MRHWQPKPCRAAFTLVELLVVLGIISVLIAFLFPVFGRVREHANRLKCASNLHSIGHALTMYTQGYGYYPGFMMGGLDSECAVWPVRLRPFLGGNQDVFYCPSQDERCRWTADAPGSVRPATEVQAAFGYVVGERTLYLPDMYFSYGYNGRGANGTETQTPYMDGTHKGLGWDVRFRGTLRANRVKVPEDMIAIADTVADGQYDGLIWPFKSGPWAVPGRVHRRGANVLFCDGHVSWHLQEELILESLSTPSPEVRRWNNDHDCLGG